MTRLTRTMKVCLALVAMAALPACSLINAPEVLPPEPYDGGADGGPVDGEVEGDADIDADGGPRDDASRPLHEICFNGEDVDDDGDGATDCADLDCASEPTCCGGAGTARLSEDWTDPTNFSLRWLLADLSDYGVVTTQDGVALSSFGDDGVLRSLLPSTPRNRCVSLGFGARIAVTLLPAGCMGCTGEAAVVLTGATTPARGVPLAADLRVAVAADGALRVTSGDTVLSDTSTVDSTGHIVIEIGAAVRDGVPVLAASVSTGATGVEESVIKGIPFIAQSLLSACKDGPGLSIALEGSGSAVTVGAVQVTELACTNPRVFGRDVADTVITSAVLPSTVGWTGGGLSAPALLPEATVQHLFYDATNVPRELESIAPIDFAIGAADALSFASPWGSFSGHALQQGDAYLGTTPPACTSPPCAAQRSVREPTASAVYSGTRIASTEDTHILAFARETDTADLYAIEYVDAPLVNTTPATGFVGGTADSYSLLYGDRTETITAGNHQTTVAVGNATYAVGAGTWTGSSGSNSFVASASGIAVTAVTGSATFAAVAGATTIQGSTGVAVTSAGPVNIRGTVVTLTAPGTKVGGIVSGADLDPIAGIPLALLGLGSPTHLLAAG